MKKAALHVTVFVVLFVVTYVMTSYYSSFRIKLDAPPMEYLAASLRSMALFKSFVSTGAGLAGVGILAVTHLRAK